MCCFGLVGEYVDLVMGNCGVLVDYILEMSKVLLVYVEVLLFEGVFDMVWEVVEVCDVDVEWICVV